MELARLPALALLLALTAFSAADAALYLRKVEHIANRSLERTIGNFPDSRLQIHSIQPYDSSTRFRCYSRTEKKYGILNNFEAKFWVKWPCSGKFIVSFSSFKKLEHHPGPIFATGTGASAEEVDVLTKPENNNIHTRLKVPLRGHLYPQTMSLVKESEFSQHCVINKTFGISQSRWKAEVWAIWPCRGSFRVSFVGKHPLSPVPKLGEEPQKCRLEFMMTNGTDETKKVEGDIVSVELANKFRGHECNQAGRHFLIKGNALTLRFQYHCVAYFKVCFRDSPRECHDVDMDNKNDKPLVKEMPGMILSLSVLKYFNHGKCPSSGRSIKNNVFTVSKSSCSGQYKICYLKRVAHPIHPTCPAPKEADEECRVIKDVYGGVHLSQIVEEAHTITCVTLIKEHSDTRCNCPVTGLPKYFGRKNKIEAITGCVADFKVCYKKYMHKEPACAATIKKDDTVCVDAVLKTGSYVRIPKAGAPACARMKRLLFSSSMDLQCYVKVGSKQAPLFSFVQYKGDSYLVSRHRRCAGVFTICYKPACTWPYKNVNGKCIFVEKRSSRNFVEAALKCNSIGGKLMNIQDPFSYFSKHKKYPDFRDKAFFIGGSRIFEDATRSPAVGVPKPPSGSKTPVVHPNVPFVAIKNWHKIKELLNIHDKPHSSILEIIRRYTGFPLPKDLQRDAPYSDRCLSMDFSHEGLEFVSCHDKQHYICEQSFQNSRGTEKTPWINLDKRVTYQVESLANLQKLHRAGELNLDPLTFCNKPVFMECRNAKYPDIEYSQYHARDGQKFKPACTNDTFFCDYKDQKTKKCPDVEIRFTCPPSAILTCRNVLVKDNCEQQNKDCRDTSFGPKCVEKVITHTGKERIGERVCNFNNKEYTMKQCVSRGDPMVRTFDGHHIKDFNSNSGSYIFFDSKAIHAENPIPDFRVVVHNSPVKSYMGKLHTRAFDLTINSTTYSFKSDGSFEIDGLKKNFMDFSDDNIDISVQHKEKTRKINIDTKFCMQVVWDSRMALYLRLPKEFKTVKSGLCGNFNGDKHDDLKVNGKHLKPRDFTAYFMVASDKKACLDCVDNPKGCSKGEHAKYSSPKYCGVFNPHNKKSPLYQYIFKNEASTRKQQENIEAMKEIFHDCLENHCRIKQYDNPCHEITTHIEEVMKDLRVRDMEKLDEDIRKYTSCKAPKCHGKHSHYSGHYWVKCQATCGTTTSMSDCGNHRGQGCTCDSGYYMDATGKCITSDDCAKDCTVDLDSGESFSIKDGETVVVEACVRTVKCVNGDLIENVQEPCSIHANCGKDGTTCNCREGYKGNGTSCVVDRTCENGFKPVGDKCYFYYSLRPTIWHRAAGLCAAMNSRLARYDAGADIDNLESFLKYINTALVSSKSKVRKMYCKPNIRCRVPYNEHAIAVAPNSRTCPKKDYVLESSNRYIKTSSACYGTFYVKSVKSTDFLNFVYPKLTPWIGGNTQVLGFNKRKGLAPLNVDPPRLIDPAQQSDLGCYQATLNAQKKLVVKMSPECSKPHHYICEYENHVDIKKENPYDIVGIPQKVNWQEAQQKCKELGRPLLKLHNIEMVKAAYNIQRTQLRGDAWIDLKFQYEKPYYIAKWNSDGNPITFSWYSKHPEPKNSKKQLTLCIFAKQSQSGKWFSDRCHYKKYALCGPRKAYQPVEYTPPMPVQASSSLASVKTFIKAHGLPSTVCSNPVEMKCRAQRDGKTGWVSNFDQPGHIITCTKEEISCKKNHGLDCSTLEVQFLCPQEHNQCKVLKEIGATPCDSGMGCYPASLHYSCLCPPGHRFNHVTRKCDNAQSCCSAWGDPHYTTFSGAKFDFMGDCKYLFAGSCKDSKDLTVPHFNIYTKNVECGKQGTCLSKVEIHLRNANVLRVANNVRIAQGGDYIFKINVGDNTYKLNGKEIEQTNYAVPGAFDAITKKAYFSLDTKIGLRVTLSGNRLDVYAPERPMFEMCGLCQKLAQKLGIITLINGTEHKIKYDSDRRYDYKQMAAIASTFVVPDPEAEDDKCDVPGEAPMPCSTQVQKELESPQQCGVFTDNDSSLKECFDKVDPKEYFDDCKFDACVQSNRTEAVCAMVKAYAQACLKKGVILAWRNEEFCPMQCGEDEVWRAVASCEPVCGMEETEHCNEDLEEGCVCKTGMKRQADRCVPEDKCGCEVEMPDGSVWNMPINKTILMPECTEKITCEVDSEGVSQSVSERFSLPQNGICHNGPPATVECAKGFQKSADGEDCDRIPGGCKDGFNEYVGMCLDKPNKETIWRHAIQVCAVKDSTLAHVDTEEKLNAIAKLMVDNKLKNVYIGGRVKAFVDENKQVKLSPRVSNGSIEYMNFDVSPYIMSVAVPTSDMTPEKVEQFGQYLALVVRLSEGSEPVVVAVPTTTKADYVCEERDVKPENTQWQPPCNSDSNMKDEGDMEYLKNMLLNSKCSVCPVPLDVKCTPAGNPSPGQTEKGRCGLNKEGLLYSCEKGEECIDMEVSTLCAKDIDECALGLHDCGRESTCVNTVGAYKCRCLKENSPLMIDGFCQESRTCSLSGPQTKNGYNFNFTGFDDVPGVFNYDCSYLMAAPKKNKFSRDMKIPYVDFALVQERNNDGLKMKMMGTIYSPKGKSPKAWMINADLLKEKMFLYGQDDQLVKHELNYISTLTNTKFVYKNPGVMMIIGLDNHYKARITMEPFSFQLEVSGMLASIMDGVCTLKPEVMGENVFMDPKQTDDITVGIKECKPYIEPPVEPTLPTPAPPMAPTTRRPAIPSTFGFPGGPPVVVPDMPVTDGVLPVDDVFIPTVRQFEPRPPAQSEPEPVTPQMLPIDDGEVSILPVPEPEPEPICDRESYEFCGILAHACDIAEEQCLSALCSGEMCKCEYISKEKFNFCNQTETLAQKLDELGCIEECDENEIFAYSVASKQATCSDPAMLPVEGEDALDEWEFGCFCEQGFVLSGGQCVRKEECGCVLDCGTYVKPYTTWRSENCTSMMRCLPGDEIIEMPMPCGPHTECLETEDGYRCECEEGFFGNPEMREGCQKGKPESDGSKVCYQYINSDGSVEERCNCTVGFISNCSDCEDMDECKLGLHDCDLSKEKCVNVPGGYQCACAQGYRLKDDVCVDIDECKEKRDNCSRNAGCINTEGSFTCECCAGYMKNNVSGLCDRDTEEFQALPRDGQCCHICNIPQICTKAPRDLEINFCYMFENGDRVNFPNGQVLFKYLCLHAVDFDARLLRPKKCEELPEIIIEPFITPKPLQSAPRTTLPIPRRTTTYKVMIDEFTNFNRPTQHPTQEPTKFYTVPAITKQPEPVPTRRSFPSSCEAADLLEHLPQPPKDMREGPVCGPLARKEPMTHQSYAHLVRFVCREVGGPNNLPRESFISAFSGPCPTRQPLPTLKTTTLGAPMRPRTTTLGAPMRPTLRTTTLGAPMRPRTTTLGAPMQPTERKAVIPFITTTTTMRPPTTKPPRPPTRPMTTIMRTTPPMRPRTTTFKIFHDTHEDIFGNNPHLQTEHPKTTTPKIFTLPPQTTPPMRTTTPMTTEPMRTTTPMTTPPMRTTTPRTTVPMRTTTPMTTEPMRTTTQGFFTTEGPFPEGICEVPPITALDATTDTPVLYEVSYSAEKVDAEFKIYGLDRGALPRIFKPSTELESSSTFNPSETKAFIATLPRGSKMEIPVELVKIISQLNSPDKVHSYLYRSYEGLFRVVATFEVDRQKPYENIFKSSSIPLDIYDVAPYHGLDDLHDEDKPVVVATHMGVRIALHSEAMCGGVPPVQTPAPVKGCHSDFTGQTYRHGETWSEGDCTNCTCDQGFSACMVMDCFMFDCKHQRDVPGQCCHECLDEEPPTATPDFTPWSQWGQCFFRFGHKKCGMGYQYREREVDNTGKRVKYEPKKDEIYEERTCFEACKEEDGTVDQDKCPPESICDHVDPVCGSTSPGPTSSFKSECSLNVQACHKGYLPIKLYSGMCDPEDDLPANQMCERDGPVRTSVKYEYKDELEECFGPVTDIKTCSSLLCKGGSNTCCKATEIEPIEVSVSCYSIKPRQFLRMKKHVHHSAVSCQCQDNGK